MDRSGEMGMCRRDTYEVPLPQPIRLSVYYVSSYQIVKFYRLYCQGKVKSSCS